MCSLTPLSRCRIYRILASVVIAIFAAFFTACAYCDQPAATARQVGGSDADLPQSSVMNWQSVPAGQELEIVRAVFDQGGYQLTDVHGQTIVVPFTDRNMYVMKFAVSADDSFEFINNGEIPILYVPTDGYLKNASVPDARWYPFTDRFQMTKGVYLGITPNWLSFLDMEWYPGEQWHGGYWCLVSDGSFVPMQGTEFFVNGRPHYGWDGYHHFASNHHSSYRMQAMNQAVYDTANHYKPGQIAQNDSSSSDRSGDNQANQPQRNGTQNQNNAGQQGGTPADAPDSNNADPPDQTTADAPDPNNAIQQGDTTTDNQGGGDVDAGDQPTQTSSDTADSSQDNVFNWTDVPQGQSVPITSAAFDQGGYQLIDDQGETIVVPFVNENMYVMKFGASTDGTYSFVNNGDVPILYVPADGYLENDAVPGARWYPFSPQYRPINPVYLDIAPTWSDFVDMQWYPNEEWHGGYWSRVDNGALISMVGLAIIINGQRHYGWRDYHDYAREHHSRYHMLVVDRHVYDRARNPDRGRKPFDKGLITKSHDTYSRDGSRGRHNPAEGPGTTRSYPPRHGPIAAGNPPKGPKIIADYPPRHGPIGSSNPTKGHSSSRDFPLQRGPIGTISPARGPEDHKIIAGKSDEVRPAQRANAFGGVRPAQGAIPRGATPSAPGLPYSPPRQPQRDNNQPNNGAGRSVQEPNRFGGGGPVEVRSSTPVRPSSPPSPPQRVNNYTGGGGRGGSSRQNSSDRNSSKGNDSSKDKDRDRRH